MSLNFPKISIESLSRCYSVKCYLTYLAIHFSLGVIFFWLLIDIENISKWKKNSKCLKKTQGCKGGSEGVYQSKYYSEKWSGSNKDMAFKHGYSLVFYQLMSTGNDPIYSIGIVLHLTLKTLKESNQAVSSVPVFYFEGYLHYKMITSQNVSSKAQIKNFFIS